MQYIGILDITTSQLLLHTHVLNLNYVQILQNAPFILDLLNRNHNYDKDLIDKNVLGFILELQQSAYVLFT